MSNLNSYWEKYKSLKWYWKVLLLLPLVLLIVILFFFGGAKDLNLKFLQNSDKKAENKYNSFQEREVKQQVSRTVLENRAEKIKEDIKKTEKRIKKIEEKDNEILWKIDNADSPDKLKSLFAELRERGRNP